MDEVEEFVACIQIILEATEHRTGNGNGILLFDSSHDHAQMLGFDHDSHAFGGDFVIDGIGDLHCESFLHLESSREHIDESWDLA